MRPIFKLAPLVLSSQLFSQTPNLEKLVIETGTFWQVPGGAVTVVQADKILLCKGYGTKQIDKKGPDHLVNAHTHFPIASLTKAFTAAAIGILIDRGKLTLDMPIKKFIPLQLSDPYATAHLTFRDCLSMRSGLPGPSTNERLFSNPAITRQELLEKILPSLPFPLGFRSHFAYQNLLFLLAATPFNPSYEAFLKQELLSALQMTETLTAHSSLQNSANKALPHLYKNGRWETSLYENLDAFLPAAGLISTASDMGHFLLFLLNHGNYRSKQILSPAALTEIFTAQTVATVEEFTGSNVLKDVLFPTTQFLNYGLGCFLHDFKGKKMIQVPGVTDGVSSVLAIVPSLNIGVFITVNAESVYFTHSLLYQIVDAFLEDNDDWNTAFSKFQL